MASKKGGKAGSQPQIPYLLNWNDDVMDGNNCGLTKMRIKIIVEENDGEMLGQREANDWEEAEENFGKLEREFKIREESEEELEE